jgi:flavin reductase (DIM6/NTAB) family NADH-FMN oxidoreductase RutF
MFGRSIHRSINAANSPLPFRRLFSSDGESQLSLSIRHLMRSSAQPVAVITTILPRNEKQSSSTQETASSILVHGATLSSFTTVSLDPPLVAFSLRRPSRLADALESVSSHIPHFIINVLSTKQEIEASGFSKPGLEPFALSSSWSAQGTKMGSGNSNTHPLSNVPFHPSTLAKDAGGISVPILSNSLGSLACSIVSRLSLNEAGSVNAATLDQSGSDLFLAKVHGVENNFKQEKDEEKRFPMVYWDQIFTTVVR